MPLLRTLTLTIAAAVALAATPAGAVPPQFVVYSALSGPDGAPIDGDRVMRFELVDAAGTSLYDSGDVAIAVAAGAFAVALPLDPEGAPFSPALLAHIARGEPVSLRITPDEQPALPLVALRSVPYAMTAGRAHVADDLACDGCVGPAALAPSARDAATIAWDDLTADLGAATLQAAVEAVAATAAAARDDLALHLADPDAHHPANAAGLDLEPLSVTVGDTRLTDGVLELGPDADDVLTRATVKSLHGASLGGGTCYTAFGTTGCGAGFSPMYTGVALTPYIYDRFGGFHDSGGVAGLGSTLCVAEPDLNTYQQGTMGWMAGVNSGAGQNARVGSVSCAVCCR